MEVEKKFLFQELSFSHRVAQNPLDRFRKSTRKQESKSEPVPVRLRLPK